MPTISRKTGLMSLKRKASSFILLIYSFSTHKALNENKKSLHLKWNLTKCHLHVVTLINTSLFVFHFFPSTNHMWSGKKKERKGKGQKNIIIKCFQTERKKVKVNIPPPRQEQQQQQKCFHISTAGLWGWSGAGGCTALKCRPVAEGDLRS